MDALKPAPSQTCKSGADRKNYESSKGDHITMENAYQASAECQEQRKTAKEKTSEKALKKWCRAVGRTLIVSPYGMIMCSLICCSLNLSILGLCKTQYNSFRPGSFGRSGAATASPATRGGGLGLR